MTRGAMWFGTVLLATGCSASFSTFHVRKISVEQVRVGQTMPEVTALLGQPQQVWPSITTASGQTQVVWEYAALATAETSWQGRLQPTRRNAIALEKAHHMTPLSEALHLIVFVEGRVSEIVTP